MRADVWNPDAHVDLSDIPTAGSLLNEVDTTFDGTSYANEWPSRVASTMW